MHRESAGTTAAINHQIILLPMNKLLSKKKLVTKICQKRFVKEDLLSKKSLKQARCATSLLLHKR